MSTNSDSAVIEGEVLDEPVVTVGEVERDEDEGDGEDNSDGDEPGSDGEDAAGGGAGGEGEGEKSGQEGEGGEGEAEEPKAAAREPWYTKRIGKLTKENSEREAKLKAAEEKIAALEAAQAGGEDGPKLFTEAEVAARIEAAATEKSAAREAVTKMDTLWDNGVKAHKDFDKRVEGYIQAFGAEALAARSDFFQAVTDLPNGHEVLYALGGDLDRMAAVLEMPAYKMGMELGKISGELAKPKDAPLSKAPAPIKPLETVNNSARDITDPKISMDDYARQREEAWKARNNR